MSEFIRKIKNRLRVFDIEHGRILSRYKIFITIMGLALSIVFVAAIAMGEIGATQDASTSGGASTLATGEL